MPVLLCFFSARKLVQIEEWSGQSYLSESCRISELIFIWGKIAKIANSYSVNCKRQSELGLINLGNLVSKLSVKVTCRMDG